MGLGATAIQFDRVASPLLRLGRLPKVQEHKREVRLVLSRGRILGDGSPEFFGGPIVPLESGTLNTEIAMCFDEFGIERDGLF